MSSTMTVCPHCHKLNKVDLSKLRNGESASCGSCSKSLEFKGAVTEVNENDFWRIVRKADKPVIVDFWASWCGPCQMYGPVFQEASLKSEDAIFLKINTEANPNIGQQLGIRGIPATLVFNNGTEVKRQAGALPIDMVLSLAKG